MLLCCELHMPVVLQHLGTCAIPAGLTATCGWPGLCLLAAVACSACRMLFTLRLLLPCCTAAGVVLRVGLRSAVWRRAAIALRSSGLRCAWCSCAQTRGVPILILSAALLQLRLPGCGQQLQGGFQIKLRASVLLNDVARSAHVGRKRLLPAAAGRVECEGRQDVLVATPVTEAPRFKGFGHPSVSQHPDLQQ